MVITKQELQDWNAHPVSKAIFSGIDASLVELRAQSCMMPTCDETAMRVAFNDGVAEGINSLKDGYEILEGDVE